jgi:hypothetical protein
MLSPAQLKILIQTDSPADIKAMRVDFASYILHVFGSDTDAYLSKINEYENEKQHTLRTKHAIRNPWVVEELIRPTDNLWQAKGGTEDYKFKGTDQSEKFKELLKDVRDGMDMKSFMKDIWFQRFISDPNGIIFCEVDTEGLNPTLTYKSIMKIHNYETKGINLNWVVFEPVISIIERIEDKDLTVEYSWAVDEKYYYYCRNTGKPDDFSIVQMIAHSFGQVPGIVNSPIFNTDKGYKVSLLDKQTDLLNSYLTLTSIKEIYQFKHNFAIPWAMQSFCPTCNGARMVGNAACGTCGGTGYSAKKDVSDILIIPTPQPDAPPVPMPPAGYIQPDIATCAENRTELDWKFDKMFHSLWGTSATPALKRVETATTAFLDNMQVYNKLNGIADICQMVQKNLTLIFGKFFFPETLDSVAISYSRRYSIDPPDMLWSRYQDARTNQSPDMALNYLLEQFYFSEFASNQTMADFYVNLIYVEPYPHLLIVDVEDLEISDDLKLAKRYFPEWVANIDPVDTVNKTRETLRKELITFAQKQTPPEKPEPAIIPQDQGQLIDTNSKQSNFAPKKTVIPKIK